MHFTKDLKFLLSAFLLSLTISSCTSLEDDTKKYAELYCKTQKIAQQIISGEVSLETGKEESERLNKEIIALKKEMEEKYQSPTEINNMTKAIAEAVEKCE